MKIGFALITEKPFMNSVIQIENRFHRESRFFDRLGAEHNLPHTTLFQGEMDNTIDYRHIARQIAAHLQQVLPDRRMVFSDVVYVPEGWYFLECERSVGLMALHRYTLQLVTPHIILEPDRMSRNLDALPEQQKKAIELYGYRYAADAFYPHITVGRTDGRQDSVLVTLNGAFKELNRDTVIERVTVYKMGNNGTHESTLYQVEL
ncbi:MAG: hypothetical protein LUG65_04170 [Clostridiales bacterium]|nr:hypothetical protein [Clostridiales bacterium]